MSPARRVSKTSAAPNISADQTMPSSAMVTDSTEKTRQNSRRPAWTPAVGGIGRSPTLPWRIWRTSTAPRARQTKPGTMKAARHDAIEMSTPGTIPYSARPALPHRPLTPMAWPCSRAVRMIQPMPTEW